jgi:O-acetyl-ADP-ribose deacetylase (regulator of RNase III)
VSFPEAIRLVDKWRPLTDAWSEVFDGYDAVRVENGDFFAAPADALVSPANSFGIMDGGLDLAIRDRLGGEVQRRAQALIIERHHGELPVGAAEIVETGHEEWPFLIVAPTMRVPEPIANTLNAYLAFRAALLAVRRFNRPKDRIRSVVVPGLGTGIGAMDARRCAAQMRVAYDQAAGPARIPSFEMIHRIHGRLRSPG